MGGRVIQSERGIFFQKSENNLNSEIHLALGTQDAGVTGPHPALQQ